MTLRFIFIFLLALGFTSCEEAVELDLRQAPPRVVIEGLVTDRPFDQSVKVTRSTDFYSVGESPRVDDAIVTVTDDSGESHPFVHNPRNHPDSIGIYLPASPFAGVPGRTYTLNVTVDGDVYEASDKLLKVIPIDSLSVRVNEDQQADPHEPGKIYEVLLYAREPQDEENYYLFKYYRNDSLVFYNETDIYFSDDALLGEEIDGVASPVFFGKEDSARLEVYSLTRAGYIYYNDLSLILTNDGGGMFGPIPAPPRTNVNNGALGFFQVSAVRQRATVIP